MIDPCAAGMAERSAAARTALTGRAAPTAPPFEVVTFNVRHGWAWDGRNCWPCRRRALVAALAELDADLLGLQEPLGFQLRYLQRHVPGYRSVGQGRGGGRRGERCPVLARSTRYELIEDHTVWYGEVIDRPGRLPGASAPRIATIARYRDRPAGRTLRVVSTHLDEHHAPHRARSAAQLAGWLDGDEPTVVLADLNTGSEPAVFDALGAAGLRPALAPGSASTVHGFDAGHRGPHLDHILVSAHLHVSEAAVAELRPSGRFPSDHHAVRALLRWRREPA